MSVRQCFAATFRLCLTDLSCAPFFLLALVFYSFYYCWPYSAQLPYKMTTAIVDEDNSPLSRRLIRGLESSPNLEVLMVTENRAEAVVAMKRENVVAIIGIPQNFAGNVMAGVPTAMSLVSNGAFIVKSRSVISGASGPLAEVAEKAIAAEMMRYGMASADVARTAMRAPSFIVQPMYNNISGYLNFVVPIVFMIIFQTLMICGTGMLFYSLFSQKPLPRAAALALARPKYLLAMQGTIFCICFFWSLMVEGAIFGLHGINSFQNIPATIALGAMLSLAVSSLGIFIGLLFRSSHFLIQAVVLSSLPCVFISGNLFPAQNIPLFMRAFAWLFPSTPGSTGMVRASQARADIGEVMPYLAHLAILAIIYFILALLVCHILRRYKKPAQ